MTDQNPYARNPQPAAAGTPITPEQERNLAWVTHAVAGAAMILTIGTLGFIAALIVYLVYKDKGPFVRQHSADALNIQVNALIWFIPSGILMIVGIGFVLWSIVAMWATVLHVIGAIKAYNGESHWSPMTIRFVK